MATQRNDQGHYVYPEQQMATKTNENRQREDTQREPWVDRWGARRKTKSEKLPSMFKKMKYFYWLLKIFRLKIGGK